MNLTLLAIRTLTFFLALTCCLGCGKPEAFQYLDISNFKIGALNSKESDISADFVLYNPNDYRIRLKEVRMDISINERHVGHYRLDTLMNIPKKDTFLIPVKMKVDMKTILSNSLSMLLSNEVNVKMNGIAKLGKAGLFFRFPFTYEGKQDIKIFK